MYTRNFAVTGSVNDRRNGWSVVFDGGSRLTLRDSQARPTNGNATLYYDRIENGRPFGPIVRLDIDGVQIW